VLPPPEASRAACPACKTAFAIDGGIVALSPPDDDRDYPQDLVELVASVESRHFWFTARNDVILTTMRSAIGPFAGLRALDVGCGTGFVLAALEGAGLDAYGIDMHHAALARARTRVRGPLFRSNAAVLPFFPDFDIVTLFDVIEHVDDDVGVLRQAHGALAPGGHVVVTVPANPKLWTSYDEVIGHKRRYDRDALAQALVKSRFEVRYLAYFNCLPLLAQIAQRWMASAAGNGQKAAGSRVEIVRRALKVPPEPLNTLFRLSVRAEAPLRRLPWMRGGSLIAVARII
jgi:SAM-dependent methyltransferase